MKPLTQEMRQALIDIQDQTTHAGYVAYVIYNIGVWLAIYDKTFDNSIMDVEYDKRVYPFTVEFIDSNWDNPDKPFMDCLNDFMKTKVDNMKTPDLDIPELSKEELENYTGLLKGIICNLE